MTSTVTNLSSSPYRATLEEIQQCMIPPTPTDGDTMIGASPNPRFPNYKLSTSGWCEKCNRSYHRSCDDMFQLLSARYKLQFDKQNPESIQNAMRLCEIPPNVNQLSSFQLGELKATYEDVEKSSSSCFILRKNHHHNCSSETFRTSQGTGSEVEINKKGPDPNHKMWLKNLSKVRDKCHSSIEKLRKVRPVETPHKPSVLKLQTPESKRIQGGSPIINRDSTNRKLTFDE
jgi:hypothetical protein